MIPVETIKLKPTADPEVLTVELTRRLTAYSPSDEAAFSSIRYSGKINRRWVARSLFKIPYLPVLVQRGIGANASIVARPSFAELVPVAIILTWMGYITQHVAVLGFAVAYHVAGYICFKLALGDLRSVLGDLADEQSSRIGWA